MSTVSPLPVAANIKQSLVDVSPSTLMRLKLLLAKSTVNCLSNGSLILALHATKANMVAISGLIMPAPFAIPVITTSPLDSATHRLLSFGPVSVVKIAFAAASQPSESKVFPALVTARVNAGTFKRSPITPVEKGCTCCASIHNDSATDSHTARASCLPGSPVAAFALPLLITHA